MCWNGEIDPCFFVHFCETNCGCSLSQEFCICVCLDWDGRTALHVGAESESDGQEKMTVLVENGADVNIQSLVHFSALGLCRVFGGNFTIWTCTCSSPKMIGSTHQP